MHFDAAAGTSNNLLPEITPKIYRYDPLNMRHIVPDSGRHHNAGGYETSSNNYPILSESAAFFIFWEFYENHLRRFPPTRV